MNNNRISFKHPLNVVYLLFDGIENGESDIANLSCFEVI